MAGGRRFEEVEEGEELPPCELLLSKERVRDYAAAAGQWAPRFTDDEGARREGLVAPLVVGGGGTGTLRRLGATFRGLVLPGRTIRLCGTVTEKDASARTVELDVWLETDEGERAVIGTATVALP
jgi:acyl dehydratase